jgi:hypothetical protein
MVPAAGAKDVYACMACYKAGEDNWHFAQKGRQLVPTPAPKHASEKQALIERIPYERIAEIFGAAGLHNQGARSGKAGEFWNAPGSGRAISIGKREMLANVFYISQDFDYGRFLPPDTRWNNKGSILHSKIDEPTLQKWAKWASQGMSTAEMRATTRKAIEEHAKKLTESGKTPPTRITALFQADWKSPRIVGD